MQYKGQKYIDLLKQTKQTWSKIPGNALEDFYQAINNSDKYTIAEKIIAKKILLGWKITDWCKQKGRELNDNNDGLFTTSRGNNRTN